MQRGDMLTGRGGTDRNDTGVVGDEVTGCDVPRLVLVAADIKGELHRALRTEFIACAVLAQTQVKVLYVKVLSARIYGVSQQIEHPPPKQAPEMFCFTHPGILHLIHNVIAGEWDETCGKRAVRHGWVR